MKAIISGATGFIGSALCQELLAAGHNVTALLRPRAARRKPLPAAVRVVEAALDDLPKLTGCYDVFYHLAWNGCGGEDRNDFASQESNIRHTVEAVRAAKRCGCARFVGAGSQTEYGRVKGRCTEATAPHPFTLYGAAKLSAYHLSRLVAAQENIRFIWPRIYSVYGVGQNSDTLVAYVLRCLQKGETPQLSSCETLWDFLYITDCAAALRLLGESEAAEGLYNVSAGQPQKLRAFVETMRDVVAPGQPLAFGARASAEEKTFWLEPDIDRLRALGFAPRVDFQRGLLSIHKPSHAAPSKATCTYANTGGSRK